MARVSIIIPGRCEQYFQRTVDDILEKATGDIEVIAVVDGEGPAPHSSDKRLKVFELEKSIGQREGYNYGVKRSTGTYIMKLDAHAMVSPGFDEVLASHCPPKTVVLPEMRRLDPAAWKHKGRGTWFMYPGLDVFCHYWREYRKRPAARVEYPEVLTGQGSCWFTTREWNDEIGLLDGSLGSWGKVGIEISLKTWLCGGQQILNKRAWQAHHFRVNEGMRPYPLNGRQIGRVRDFTFDNFYFAESGAFPNQVRPFSWLMDKFRPVPGWEAYEADRYKTPRAIVYYTDSRLEESLANAVRKNLQTVAGPIPIISVSQKPLNFGKNICVGVKQAGERRHLYEAVLEGAKAAPEGTYIYLCEHDVFYHPSHFAKTGKKDKRAFWFNKNRYYWWVGDTAFYRAPGLTALSQSVVYRDYLIETCERFLAQNPIGKFKARRYNWESARPNVDVRHGQNLTKDGPQKRRMRKTGEKRVYHLGGWGGVSHFQSKVKYKGTMRWDIVQHLIDTYGYKKYLEIGCDRNACFKKIRCPYKVGVDPVRGGTLRMTSDEYFEENETLRTVCEHDMFDMIFIDGLHEAWQVEKDIANALDILLPGGTIAMHDCSPRTEKEQRVPKADGIKAWTGDVWKAYMKYRMRSDLEMYVVDTNNGIGIVRPGHQAPVAYVPDVAEFFANKEKFLNTMSVAKFRKKEGG